MNHLEIQGSWSQRDVIPYQSPRAPLSLSGARGFSPIIHHRHPACSDGQYNHHVLPEQAGGHQVQSLVTRGLDNLELAVGQEPEGNGNSPPKRPECSSRRSQQSS